MREIVVDASVAIKWFVEEIHSEAAALLVDPAIEISAPDLIGPEFGNILWKKIRRREVARAAAADILAAFQTTGIVTYPSADLLPAALEIAGELERSLYDSLYLALAVARDCQLVSADQKFVSAIIASPLGNHIRFVGEEWTH